jgi:hypothetical protein
MRKKITFHQAPNFVVHAEYIEVISKPRLATPPLPAGFQQLCVKVPEMRFEFMVP